MRALRATALVPTPASREPGDAGRAGGIIGEGRSTRPVDTTTTTHDHTRDSFAARHAFDAGPPRRREVTGAARISAGGGRLDAAVTLSKPGKAMV
jgi:hypothetical protein